MGMGRRVGRGAGRGHHCEGPSAAVSLTLRHLQLKWARPDEAFGAFGSQWPPPPPPFLRHYGDFESVRGLILFMVGRLRATARSPGSHQISGSRIGTSFDDTKRVVNRSAQLP